MSEASLSIGRQCVGAFLKRACRKNAFKQLNIRSYTGNVGTACVSECVLKTPAKRVGVCVSAPSKSGNMRQNQPFGNHPSPKHLWRLFLAPKFIFILRGYFSRPSHSNSGSSERGQRRRGWSEIPHFSSTLQLLALVQENEEKNEEKLGKAKKTTKKERIGNSLQTH